MSTSASGARIQGDDYQHLLAWHQALRLILPDSTVESVGIESQSSGNVDDVVVTTKGAPIEYFQVKYSVDASKPISSEWLTTPNTPKGKSPLQQFAASWKLLRAQDKPPKLTLFTNRVLDPEDPILKLRDGQNGTLAPRLADATPRSAAGKQLSDWASHATLSEAELLEMLQHWVLKTDRGAWSELVETVGERMGFAGLRRREIDVQSGVTAIREWVKAGVRNLDREQVSREVERRGLKTGERQANLVVEAIDHLAWTDGAQVKLDWVDLFAGAGAAERRQLKDPSLWRTRIQPEMQAAARRLEAFESQRVVVRGYMRLPIWFLAGTAFPDTRGRAVAAVQRQAFWSSDATPTPFEVESATTDLNQGEDVAIGVSVTNAIGIDVLEYCRSAELPVRAFVEISPSAGCGPRAIADGAAALGWAIATRAAARTAVRDLRAKSVHLFISAPGGGALLLGHLWNRVGVTTVYEDLSPGYAPTFDVP